MAFNNANDILQAVKGKENELRDLRERMEADFDLFALTPYEPQDAAGNALKGVQTYTSSEPKNFFNKVLDGLNQAALTIQILLPENATEEERRQASLGELFLFGALSAIDRRLAKRGEPPLRESLGHFMCLRGLYALRALVYTPRKNEDVVFDVIPWDPLHVSWEMGSDGPLWIANKRQASAAQIKSEYGVDIDGKMIEVVDFFDEKRNAVIVGTEFAKKLTPHNIGHVPGLVRFVGSMPSIQKGDFATAIKYQGDSVWASSRDLYKAKNKYISSLMELQERNLTGSLVYENEGGLKAIEGDPYRTRQVIKLVAGKEKLYPLELLKAPPEVAAIADVVGRDIEQGTLPTPFAYGGTMVAMSGRALAILADATRSAYTPGTGAMAQAFTWVCEELLTQFVKKGTKEVEFRGYDKTKPKEQQYFTVKIGPKDINPDWVVSVRVEPRLPRDEEAAIQMALAATQRRGAEDIALMAKSTARERYMLMQDPEAENDKVLAEMGSALPPILAARIVAAMRELGDEQSADEAARVLGVKPPEKGVQLPPQLIEAIVKTLIAGGQLELAKAFVRALGAMGGAPPAAEPPPGGEVPPTAPAEAIPPEQPPPEGGMMGAGPSPGQAPTTGAPGA